MFKLPRHHFEKDSEALHDIFYTSGSKNAKKRSIGDHFIHLRGVSKSVFHLIVQMMFCEPLWGQLHAQSKSTGKVAAATQVEPSSWRDWASVLKLSTELKLKSVREISIQNFAYLEMDARDWIDVLRVGTQWGLLELHQIAMTHLKSGVEVVEKIHLAIELKITKWLPEGYRELVTRDKEISLDEEERLGWETTSKLFRLRHLLLQRHIKEPGVDEAIRQKFSTQFETIASPSQSQPNSTQAVTKAYLINEETATWVNSLQFPSVIFLVCFIMHIFNKAPHAMTYRWKIRCSKSLGTI